MRKREREEGNWTQNRLASLFRMFSPLHLILTKKKRFLAHLSRYILVSGFLLQCLGLFGGVRCCQRLSRRGATWEVGGGGGGNPLLFCAIVSHVHIH